jgi:hypothetical protein
MWTCTNCHRIFEKIKQPHSCHKIPLDQHFENKNKARELFNFLVKKINKVIGKCQIVSIPCCVHLFGKYDFMALLPKKAGLEIRFALDRKLDSPRVRQTVAMSKKVYKICIDISSQKDIDQNLMDWLKQSFNLKNNISDK